MDDIRLVMTVEEAARALGISRALGYALVRDGVIPSLRLGRRLVVPRSQLRALIEGADATPTAGTGASEQLGAGDRHADSRDAHGTGWRR